MSSQSQCFIWSPSHWERISRMYIRSLGHHWTGELHSSSRIILSPSDTSGESDIRRLSVRRLSDVSRTLSYDSTTHAAGCIDALLTTSFTNTARHHPHSFILIPSAFLVFFPRYKLRLERMTWKLSKYCLCLDWRQWDWEFLLEFYCVSQNNINPVYVVIVQ